MFCKFRIESKQVDKWALVDLCYFDFQKSLVNVIVLGNRGRQFIYDEYEQIISYSIGWKNLSFYKEVLKVSFEYLLINLSCSDALCNISAFRRCNTLS